MALSIARVVATGQSEQQDEKRARHHVQDDAVDRGRELILDCPGRHEVREDV